MDFRDEYLLKEMELFEAQPAPVPVRRSAPKHPEFADRAELDPELRDDDPGVSTDVLEQALRANDHLVLECAEVHQRANQLSRAANNWIKVARDATREARLLRGSLIVLAPYTLVGMWFAGRGLVRFIGGLL